MFMCLCARPSMTPTVCCMSVRVPSSRISSNRVNETLPIALSIVIFNAQRGLARTTRQENVGGAPPRSSWRARKSTSLLFQNAASSRCVYSSILIGIYQQGITLSLHYLVLFIPGLVHYRRPQVCSSYYDIFRPTTFSMRFNVGHPQMSP